MRLLLDTHALLWWRADTARFSSATYEMISAGEIPVLVSHVSLWEIAIKSGLGKLSMPDNLLQRCQDDGFELLPITLEHIEMVKSLPSLHRDPFDRMLIAQAKTEDMFLLTRDADIRRYDVKVLSA